jgi:hypothetical protein
MTAATTRLVVSSWAREVIVGCVRTGNGLRVVDGRDVAPQMMP